MCKIRNILSIDVEEIFHTEYARHLDRKNLAFRSPINIKAILNLLSDRNVTATFFIVGEIAEKFPEVVKMIVEEGHEVAFHGWSHLPLWELTATSFREEINRFKKIYPSCIGYRAPSFSLNNDTKWALKVLQESGFHYDSSLFPALTPLYGVFKAPMKPYTPSITDVSKEDDNGLTIFEFPLAVYNILGFRIPIAGGFWLRFWGARLIEKGIKKLNKEGFPAVLFIHNWELDKETPKLRLNPYRSFVTYHNQEKSLKLLTYLLNTFPFTSFMEYLKSTSVIQ